MVCRALPPPTDTIVSLTSLDHSPSHVEGDDRSHLAYLQHVIEHAGHMLPAQGPITVFVHHNTLHAFEDLTFEEAVLKGSRIFNNQPYLAEDAFRERMAQGRITPADLLEVLHADLGARAEQPVLRLGSRLDLRMAMMQHPLRIGPSEELRWFVAETDALTTYRRDVNVAVRQRFVENTRHWVMRDLGDGDKSRGGHREAQDQRRTREALRPIFEHFGAGSQEQWSEETWEAFSLHALWRVCRDGVEMLDPAPTPPFHAVRHRDLLLEATGEDSDLLVNDLLIRFCAAFLDQGFSPWPLPNRQLGFYQAFCKLYGQPGGPPNLWLQGLSEELARLESGQIEPIDSVWESLQLLGVEEHEYEEFITATLLSLRGWAGMTRQMEIRADRAAHPVPQGSLVEFLAIRLMLERLALAFVAHDAIGFNGPLADLRHAARSQLRPGDDNHVEQRAFLVFQLAQVRGWLPSDLGRLTTEEWAILVSEIEAFPGLERRRIFHLAFERRYRVQTLDALMIKNQKPSERIDNPRFQVVTCIDEREESFRRHIEEIEPRAETFSIAGFFIVAMYYRGAADAHFVPLAPIIIRPQHWVTEDVAYTLGHTHRRRAKARRVLGTASHQLHVGSRSFVGGALVTGLFGVLASVPLVARVLFPRLAASIRRMAGQLLQPPESTKLELERTEELAGPDDGHVGFSVAEMVNIADRALHDLGLTSGFAPLVFLIGHGSNSLNNPHNSAYNCGACGGGAGGPNARALAQILNDKRVRESLAERGLTIPAETSFVGAIHNTCNDTVTFFDLDDLPRSHHAEFEEISDIFRETCDRNAHERCRRFQSASLTMSTSAARRHVEERSEDLAQTRPECGHATNALCIVARRERTRGLFLDRRAFLNSYDPNEDDAERTILTRILSAAVPVCAGINLEYYFSYVDPGGWGCGTKLPHNVTSLLGIMDGPSSDLRPGLPWQMVEIHEPVRLLFIVETTPEAMTRIMDRNEVIGKLCRHGWVQVATLDPNSSQIHMLVNDKFVPYRPEQVELPVAKSSIDWYRGWRDHLGFALLDPEA